MNSGLFLKATLSKFWSMEFKKIWVILFYLTLQIPKSFLKINKQGETRNPSYLLRIPLLWKVWLPQSTLPTRWSILSELRYKFSVGRLLEYAQGRQITSPVFSFSSRGSDLNCPTSRETHFADSF